MPEVSQRPIAAEVSHAHGAASTQVRHVRARDPLELLADEALADVLVAIAEYDMATGDAREAANTLRTAVAYCPSHVPALTSYAQVGAACRSWPG